MYSVFLSLLRTSKKRVLGLHAAVKSIFGLLRCCNSIVLGRKWWKKNAPNRQKICRKVALELELHLKWYENLIAAKYEDCCNACYMFLIANAVRHKKVHPLFITCFKFDNGGCLEYFHCLSDNLMIDYSNSIFIYLSFLITWWCRLNAKVQQTVRPTKPF